MQIGITKMSSKGQIVIPQDLRKNFKEGEQFIVMKDKDTLILKRAKKLDKQFLEDLEFAKRTEAAYLRIKAGGGIRMSADEFIKKMEKW